MITKSGDCLPVAAIGGMKWTWNLYGPVNLEQSAATLKTALHCGLIHIDTADCYLSSDAGLDNETFIGSELQKYLRSSHMTREKIFLATKCAIKLDPMNPWKRLVDISPDYILSACQNSLVRLNMDYLDLFYLHRIDERSAMIEESMQAMHQLRKAGKIRYIGLSEANPDFIKRADTELKRLSSGRWGLDAVQTEYNLLRRGPEIDGVFKVCHTLGIHFFAYSPLCRGLVTDSTLIIAKGDCRNDLERFQDKNLEHNMNIVKQLKVIAKHKNFSMAQLSIAWIKQQANLFSINIYPLFGTSNPAHLIENFKALDITLETNELLAINKIAPIGIAKGLRYPAADMAEFTLSPD